MMEILSVVLFLLGIVFLLLGWRWQSTPNQEVRVALKGLANLKRDFKQVQDQINVMEDQIRINRQTEFREAKLREKALREIELKEAELNETIVREAEQKETVLTEPESNKKNKLYVLNDKPQRTISPKYQEVLELAANGYRIPDIAERLLLSQDAVMMVLKTQPKGETR